jgi:TolB protein
MRLIAALVLALSGAPGEPRDEDVLGDIVVEASESGRAGPVLMKIAVPTVSGSGPSAELADAVLRRDLDLSGQFVLVEEDRAGLQALVRTSIAPTGDGDVRLHAAVYFDPTADAPAYETSVTGPRPETRALTHRLVDAVIGVLTGYRGPFVSQLTFVLRRGDTRSVYTIDADGHGLRRVTGPTQLAAAAALGPDDAVYYSASMDHGRYRLYREGRAEPFELDPPGSIYGIAFSPDRTQVALTVAVGRDVLLFRGNADLTDLRRAGKPSLALQPTFAPDGRLAVAATNALKPRIRVDGRAVSPRGGSASSPSFCDHPDGPKLAYALGARARSYIVVTDPRGRISQRVSRSSGRDSHPACSPDGRLIAFFSTRKSGDGPGLYVMRTDGFRPRKIADVLGDSLQWSRLRAVASDPPPARTSAEPPTP